jgi:hypothetical protein
MVLYWLFSLFVIVLVSVSAWNPIFWVHKRQQDKMKYEIVRLYVVHKNLCQSRRILLYSTVLKSPSYRFFVLHLNRRFSIGKEDSIQKLDDIPTRAVPSQNSIFVDFVRTTDVHSTSVSHRKKRSTPNTHYLRASVMRFTTIIFRFTKKSGLTSNNIYETIHRHTTANTISRNIGICP